MADNFAEAGCWSICSDESPGLQKQYTNHSYTVTDGSFCNTPASSLSWYYREGESCRPPCSDFEREVSCAGCGSCYAEEHWEAREQYPWCESHTVGNHEDQDCRDVDMTCQVCIAGTAARCVGINCPICNNGTPNQPNKPHQGPGQEGTEECSLYCSSHTHYARQYEERSRVRDLRRIIGDPLGHIRERRRRREMERVRRLRHERANSLGPGRVQCPGCGGSLCELERGLHAARSGAQRREVKERRRFRFKSVRFAD